MLATRRPRSATERTVWGVHVAAVGRPGAAEHELVGAVTCETDRARFLGRTRGVRRPAVLDDAADGPLSGTTGAVLDPVFALRARLRVEAGQSARVAFTTLVAPDRARAIELADRYHDPYSAQRALDLSWMQAQVELRELDISPADAALYQDVAGYLTYATPAVRAPQRDLQQARRGQDALWAQGISGDNPILLATVDSPAGLPTVRELLAAHHYWRLKGLAVDLVLLNTYPPTYLQELQDALTTTVMASSEGSMLDKPGGVFIRRRDVMPADDLVTLRAMARVEVPCDSGLRLTEILEVPVAPPDYPAAFVPQVQTANAIVAPSTLAAAAARSAADGGPPPAVTVARRGPAVLAPLRVSSPPASPAPAAPRPASRSAPPASGNGLGALTDDGAYEIVLREEANDAGAVGQRDRQRARGLHRVGERRRLLVGRQQLLLPAHAVAQRSGDRWLCRGALPARRRDGRGLDADAAAGAALVTLHGPPRCRVHGVPPYARRHCQHARLGHGG